MNQWISSVNSYYYYWFIFHLTHERLVFPELGIASDDKVVAHALPKIQTGLEVAEKQLGHGKDFLLGILDECSAVAKAAGHEPAGPFFQRVKGLLTAEGSPMTASMFRDIKAGLPVEADHVIGDLVSRADAARIPAPKLRIAYTHLKAYEKQRG